mgnify:CR=1 FL=1
MNKIITLNEIESINRKSKNVVLVGGFFDIFHIGHLKFLEAAKKKGGLLIVALESDQNAKRLKGICRPIHSQTERAKILSTLSLVDYVLLLESVMTDQDYFALVKNIKPDIIAVTENDPIIEKKRMQAEAVGGKLLIIPKISTPSTTQLAKLLEID